MNDLEGLESAMMNMLLAHVGASRKSINVKEGLLKDVMSEFGKCYPEYVASSVKVQCIKPFTYSSAYFYANSNKDKICVTKKFDRKLKVVNLGEHRTTRA